MLEQIQDQPNYNSYVIDNLSYSNFIKWSFAIVFLQDDYYNIASDAPTFIITRIRITYD